MNLKQLIIEETKQQKFIWTTETKPKKTLLDTHLTNGRLYLIPDVPLKHMRLNIGYHKGKFEGWGEEMNDLPDDINEVHHEIGTLNNIARVHSIARFQVHKHYRFYKKSGKKW